MRLSIAVIHAPFSAERRANLITFQRRLGGLAALRAQGHSLVVNPERRPPALPGEVRDLWPRAHETIAQGLAVRGATHLLLIPDDVLPCRRFLDEMTAIIELRPDDFLAVYCQLRGLSDRTKAAGKHWAVSTNYAMGGGILFPVPMARDFLAWQKDHINQDLRWEDWRYRLYLAFGVHKPAWIPEPSLLEHLGATNSLLRKPNKTWVAGWFLGDDDPSPDWTKGLLDPVRSTDTLGPEITMHYIP